MYDVIAVGRVSVDLYANERNSSFADPQTFTKTIGGSPTSVAVASARLNHRAALATKVGQGKLGEFVLHQLHRYGVDTALVTVEHDSRTPLVLASLTPPENPDFTYFRGPGAPDTSMPIGQIPREELMGARVLWVSACALAEGSTADSCLAWMEVRSRSRHNVVDLDYRPSFWPSPEAAREASLDAVDLATVVVGNLDEYDLVLGTAEPHRAADAALARGASLAVVKQGASGVLVANSESRYHAAPHEIEVVCGLGAGDAFGGALIHGLLNGWGPQRMAEYGNAAGAIVASQIMCCDANPTMREIEDLLAARNLAFD